VVKNTAIGDVGGIILSGAGGEAICGPACAIYVHAGVAAWAWFTRKMVDSKLKEIVIMYTLLGRNSLSKLSGGNAVGGAIIGGGAMYWYDHHK
jgi:hypothetical protein